MGRPSKLTPQQWAEVERRLIEGESKRALGREFGISDSAIRERLVLPPENVRSAAAKLVEAEAAIASLPVTAQVSARNLAAKLRDISSNLASAAVSGSATARHLAEVANTQAVQVKSVGGVIPEQGLTALRETQALIKVSNEAASTSLTLLGANKEAVKRIGEQDDPPPGEAAPLSSLMTNDLEELARILGKLAPVVGSAS